MCIFLVFLPQNMPSSWWALPPASALSRHDFCFETVPAGSQPQQSGVIDCAASAASASASVSASASDAVDAFAERKEDVAISDDDISS